MRPGDTVIGVSKPQDKNLHLCAVERQDGSYAINILNTSQDEKLLTLQLSEYVGKIRMPKNSVQTIIVKL